MQEQTEFYQAYMFCLLKSHKIDISTRNDENTNPKIDNSNRQQKNKKKTITEYLSFACQFYHSRFEWASNMIVSIHPVRANLAFNMLVTQNELCTDTII